MKAKMKLYGFAHHPIGCIITSVNWQGRRLTPVIRVLGERHYIILRHRNVTSRFWLTPTQEEALQAFLAARKIREYYPQGIE